MRGVAERRNQGSEDNRSSTPAGAPRGPRAMLFALLPLILVVLGVAGLMGRCSFSPLGPSVDPETAPTVEVGRELDSAARRVDFPVLRPRLPEGWRANSTDVRRVAPDHEVVQVGWLTGRTHYLRLSQSPASEAELVSFETEQRPRALGTVEAAGHKWVVYRSIRSERAWVSERDGVRLLITGNGDEREFRTMARAVSRASVVRPGP
ncbi:Protein of unknown function [Actinopolyspora xinjiangensis]|uniref:DUF4245 domain-containing protein n=1 Tax=Actinopolyspora xinjiangensis TaxID=405564 RepID=A0A1H0QQ08_9ACTN|nr:DUF4245 domain-containing protein [Actinopolyspora xinjiangensis]SDP19352.1 Protein of unknown function [Actinopolyspora xinjiangensis]